MNRWGRTTLFSVMRDPGFISAPMNMNEHPVVTIMNHPLLGPYNFHTMQVPAVKCVGAAAWLHCNINIMPQFRCTAL